MRGTTSALLPTCESGNDRGVLASHRPSYRKSFSQNLFTRPLRQVARCQQVHSHAQQLLESDLESAQIKKRGARYRINQKVQVAVLAVSPVQNRPISARISSAALLDQAANFVAMKVQRSERFQR